MSAKDSIRSQYAGALAMLRQAIEDCPDALWDDAGYANRFWHVAFHAIFFTHLYAQPQPEDLEPWEKHRQELIALGQQAPGDLDTPYTKDELLAYLTFCKRQVGIQLKAADLDAPSGFHWLPYDRLGVDIYNIRHLQQHTGELCERLGAKGEFEVDWVKGD